MILKIIKSYRKLIFFTVVGIASFIFFGLFLPIILSNVPSVLQPLSNRKNRHVRPKKSRFSVMGSDVINSIVTQLDLFQSDSRYAISLHCLRDKLGEENGEEDVKSKNHVLGRCDKSSYYTFVSPYWALVADALNPLPNKGSISNPGSIAFDGLMKRCLNDSVICDNALPVMLWRYTQTGDDGLLEYMRHAGDEILSNTVNTLPEQLFQIHNLIGLYRATGDNSYIAVADTRFSSMKIADEKFTDNERLNTSSDDPIIAKISKESYIYRWDCGRYWVGAELADAMHDMDAFEKSKKFFEQSDSLAPNIGHIGALTMCLEGLSFLQKSTGEDLYRDIAKRVIETALTDYWDSPHDPKFTGDNGLLLLDYYTSETNQVLNFKYYNETVWFLTHLIQFKRTLLTF